MLWRVEPSGRYDAQWEIPLDAPMGTYRLLVTAKRYRVESAPFKVEGAASLKLVEVPAAGGPRRGRARVPGRGARRRPDRAPVRATGGTVVFRVGNRNVRVRRKGSTFSVPAPAGTPVSVAHATGARHLRQLQRAVDQAALSLPLRSAAWAVAKSAI